MDSTCPEADVSDEKRKRMINLVSQLLGARWTGSLLVRNDLLRFSPSQDVYCKLIADPWRHMRRPNKRCSEKGGITVHVL